MSNQYCYLYIQIIAGSKWIDFVKELITFFCESDKQYITWIRTNKEFIFHVQNTNLIDSITSFITYYLEQYEDYVSFCWCNQDELPLSINQQNVTWHSLVTSYNQLLHYND